MTKEQAKAIVEQFCYLQLSAQPSRITNVGWEISCACVDGKTRLAFSQNDVKMLASTGLIRVK